MQLLQFEKVTTEFVFVDIKYSGRYFSSKSAISILWKIHLADARDVMAINGRLLLA